MVVIIWDNKMSIDLNSNYIIVITGISASGKSTLSKYASERLKIKSLSLDDFKVSTYENIGFVNEYERQILWDLSKNQFQSEIIQLMRRHQNLIVEYAFNKSWNTFFEEISKAYKYQRIIVNCNTLDFDTIWKRREERDSNSAERKICLTSSMYINDKIYKNNGKLNNTYKEQKRLEYEIGKYNQLSGDTVVNNKEFLKWVSNI